MLFEEVEKSEFNIRDYYTPSQIAELSACYSICMSECIGDVLDSPYSLKELTEKNGAKKVCKEAKDCTEYGNDTFAQDFSILKKTALEFLKFPLEEIQRFSKKCDVALHPEAYTPEDIERINNL